MNSEHTKIVQLLSNRSFISMNELRADICELDEETFFNELLNYASLEQPMNSGTSIEDVKDLSHNVQKEVLYQLFFSKCEFKYISTIYELLEYSEFYYYNSPQSPGLRKPLSGLEAIKEEFKELLIDMQSE